jgi:hypothetical protein
MATALRPKEFGSFSDAYLAEEAALAKLAVWTNGIECKPSDERSL